MQSLEENGYRELARVFREWAASHAPDWTDHNDADAGVTILELMAFVAEGFAARGETLPHRAHYSAARLANAALAIAGSNALAQNRGLARNHYFTGRLLGAEDFQLEQDYVRERLRRHNRALHGAGIVEGMQVSVRPDGGSGAQVVVQPGLALDPHGEEIEIRCEASTRLPETGEHLFVMLSYAERLNHPVAVPNKERVQFARVEETFALRLEETAGKHDVALARLVRTADGWRVDEALSAPCAILRTS